MIAPTMSTSRGPLVKMVHRVSSARMSTTSRLVDGELELDEAAALGAVDSPALAEVRLTWVSPGRSARLVKVLDAVQPRSKGSGGGGIFPGFLAPPHPQGRGVTHVCEPVAVVTAGYLPRAQEAVVEMSGEAARLSPLGGCHCLVVEFAPAAGAGWPAVDQALRLGALRLAALVAEVALDCPPDEVIELAPCSPRVPRANGSGRPRVGAITYLQCQGVFKDVFVYGSSLAAGLPTLLDPNEVEDGAVVSGQFGHPGLKNPTFMHQNHPVAAALRAHDGKDLDFAGLVVAPEPVELPRKQLVAAHAARLCADMGLDAVVVTKEGGGNADLDMAMAMDEAESLGLVAVGMFAEMAGPDGTGVPVVSPPERATAMVSTGNYDERIVLPAVEVAFGGQRVELVGMPATAELGLPTAALYCSLNPLGWGNVRAEEVR
jgi:sarcosine reductase